MSVQQEKFKAIADKIREKTGSTDKIKPSEFADKIDDVYLAGQNSGGGSYDEGYEEGKKTIMDGIDGLYRFFTFGQNMNLLPYVLNKYWENKEINMQYAFQDNNVITDFIASKTLRTKTPNGLFFDCINLKTVSGLDKMITGIVITDLFNGCRSLEDAGTINFEGIFYATRTFAGCIALKEIRIVGTIEISLDFKDSTLLSKESIASIVNALSQTTSGLTITFSKTAVNNAFGINVDNPSTYPEGSEFYVLRNSRNNWTFNYA